MVLVEVALDAAQISGQDIAARSLIDFRKGRHSPWATVVDKCLISFVYDIRLLVLYRRHRCQVLVGRLVVLLIVVIV